MKSPSKSSRRRFLVQSVALPAATLLPAASSVAQQPARATDPDRRATFRPESAETLRALGEVVLPAGELVEGDLDLALRRFARWADALEPVAELDHPYLSTDEIAYGPPDPRPAWSAQLSVAAALGEPMRRALDDMAGSDSRPAGAQRFCAAAPGYLLARRCPPRPPPART